MSGDENVATVAIACALRRETDKAYLIFDGTLEAWVAKSLVETKTDARGKINLCLMPEWLARQKGFFVNGAATGDLFE